MLISFIGLMGSGKTTVGRALAQRLQLPFFDSDQLIEELLGYSIREFFQQSGEPAFRELEQSIIEQYTLKNHAVLSTGGGVCERLVNREHLNTRSYCIYLKATPLEIYRRIKNDKTRPLLSGTNPLEKLRELHHIRDAHYQATAHQTFITSHYAKNHLVNQIQKHLEAAHVI